MSSFAFAGVMQKDSRRMTAQHIFLRRHRFKMVGVTAPTIPAQMVELQAVRHRTMLAFVRKHMGMENA
jgi:hypothetical protein